MHESHVRVCSSVALQEENSMPPEKDFDNKRVVIVGGSSGIGLAVAEEAKMGSPNSAMCRSLRTDDRR